MTDRLPPIFVVGFSRSGTTLLQALLGAHSRISAPPEIAFFARVWRHRFTVDSIYAGAARGSAQYLRIRYEDLTSYPNETMRLVCAFIDEPFEPAMVTDTGRRRREFPDAAREFLVDVTQQVEARPS